MTNMSTSGDIGFSPSCLPSSIECLLTVLKVLYVENLFYSLLNNQKLLLLSQKIKYAIYTKKWTKKPTG